MGNTTNKLIQSMETTFNQCILTAIDKNHDYSSNTDPFKNFKSSEFVGVPVERAILVRMMDKMARISNGLNSELLVKDETIHDTLMDIINYSAILKAYLEIK